MGGTVWDHSPSFTEKKTRSDLGQRLSQLGHISFQTTYFVYYVVSLGEKHVPCCKAKLQFEANHLSSFLSIFDHWHHPGH